MLRMSKTTMATSAFLVLLTASVAQGSILQGCGNCLLEFPKVFVSGLLNDECKWFECGWGNETVDFEACGCATEMDSIYQCFEDCVPTCINETVASYATCVDDNKYACGARCKEEYRMINATDIAENIADAVEDVDLNISLPACLQDIFNQPFGDSVDCLFPSYPDCAKVQDAIVDHTCDATSCCFECSSEFAAMQECAYNWISGFDCSFTCPQVDEDTFGRGGRFRKRELAVAQHMHQVMLRHGRGKDVSLEYSTQRRLDTAVTAAYELCSDQLKMDVVERPNLAMQHFADCITHDAVEQSVVNGLEALPPDDDDDDENSGDDDDDDDGNSSTSGAVFKSIWWAATATATVASSLVM
mmetsp:Transcript_16902/g.36856  ORF Transcript_16902/g.36856 Transcript_16902/m.36856 type:complete len:358 (+) Transcript_16902:109-1182(+)